MHPPRETRLLQEHESRVSGRTRCSSSAGRRRRRRRKHARGQRCSLIWRADVTGSLTALPGVAFVVGNIHRGAEPGGEFWPHSSDRRTTRTAEDSHFQACGRCQIINSGDCGDGGRTRWIFTDSLQSGRDGAGLSRCGSQTMDSRIK